MIFSLKHLYHVRKPRVLSENDLSLITYRKTMRQARRNVHIEAQEYQNKIQDEYLQRHKQEMRQRHFDNQCSFRKQVFTWAYRLYQNQKLWKEKDDNFNSKQNKHIHDEDVRKINRNRILKIMEHQSSNYWFNSENVDERLTDETIFPEYIASTEYYYKLFGESLAYQTADFEQVHEISSSQETIRQKNKLLIPLFLELRSKVTQYKEDISKDEKSPPTEPQQKVQLLKNKIKDLLIILKIWKEYTNVLGLTSAQIIKRKYDVQNEISINKLQKNILKTLKNKQSETFIGSIQEDTEELQISFEDYLKKIEKDLNQSEAPRGGNVQIDQLNDLLKNSKEENEDKPNQGTVRLNQIKGLALGNLISSKDANNQSQQSSQQEISQINPQFLNARETTSSIQILKLHFKDDVQFISLLNKIGEMDVRYPQLFQKIWSEIHI